MQFPYLTGTTRARFDQWLDETVARYCPPLTFAELRKGAQALSSIYVETRERGSMAARAIEGQGKRGAFASYFAALHFLAAHHAFTMAGLDDAGEIERVIDIGCGTGAVSAAIATLLPRRPKLLGIDRSGWALEETQRTWGAFGLAGSAKRSELPSGFPAAGRGDLLLFAWSLSEFDAEGRAALQRRVISALRKGARLFVIEPLSKEVTPWWGEWEQRLAPLGIRSELCKVAIQRPFFIADMDKAARLDHQVVGGRVFEGPLPKTAR